MKRITGILLIAISAASFGTLAIFGRYAYADGMDIFTVLFLRFTISASIMTIILLLRKEPFPRGRILLQLIGMGALGYVGQSFSYLTAIKYASAGLVALLLYLYPMFVFVLSVIVLREKITWIKILAIVIALIGTALTVDPAGGQLKGILLAIFAALIYSVYIIV
ncbi:MAG TPA: DMT family transporter, partial [Anaerolineales bacterium]|nr:DMT family transporter [Anaerolineales bacterium]